MRRSFSEKRSANRVRRLLILGVLALAPASPASAASPQNSQARERFLRMIIARQNVSVRQALGAKQKRLEARLQTLSRTTPQNPGRARQIARQEQILGRELQQVGRLAASPPPSPLQARLARRQQLLILRRLQTDRELARLESIRTASPARRRLILQAEQRLERQRQANNIALGSTERLLATPFTPTQPLNVFGFR